MASAEESPGPLMGLSPAHPSPPQGGAGARQAAAEQGRCAAGVAAPGDPWSPDPRKGWQTGFYRGILRGQDRSGHASALFRLQRAFPKRGRGRAGAVAPRRRPRRGQALICEALNPSAPYQPLFTKRLSSQMASLKEPSSIGLSSGSVLLTVLKW